MPPLSDLPAAYLAIERERDGLKGENGALKDEVATLRWQLEKLRKLVFGSGKNEKLDRAQLTLALKELEAAVEAAERPAQAVSYERRAPAAERRPAPERLFEKLPVAEVVVIEPEAVKADPEAFEKIGEERTFEVEIVAPKLFKREIVRPKYKLKADRSQPPVIARAGARGAGRPRLGRAARLGLHRQIPGSPAALPAGKTAGALGRADPAFHALRVDPHRGRLARTDLQGDAATPARRRLRAGRRRSAAARRRPRRRRGPVAKRRGEWSGCPRSGRRGEQTPIKCQDPDQPGLGIFQGYLWVVARPGTDVCFDWRASRQHAEATTLLKGFKGVLQADGYAAYDALAAERPAGEIVRLGCWAHARRKLFEAQGEDPREATVLLRFIGWVYHRENRWDEADAQAQRERDPAARVKLRRAHFTRGFAWLHARVLRLRERVRPKSALGAAAGYLLGQWESLRAHLQHGQTRLDTNVVENHIRPTALGKKNWLFIGRPEAGQRTAILYSIIISCIRHGHDPEAYLRDLLTRLPTMSSKDDLAPLTPSRWKAPMSAATASITA